MLTALAAFIPASADQPDRERIIERLTSADEAGLRQLARRLSQEANTRAIVASGLSAGAHSAPFRIAANSHDGFQGSLELQARVAARGAEVVVHCNGLGDGKSRHFEAQGTILCDATANGVMSVEASDGFWVIAVRAVPARRSLRPAADREPPAPERRAPDAAGPARERPRDRAAPPPGAEPPRPRQGRAEPPAREERAAPPRDQDGRRRPDRPPQAEGRGRPNPDSGPEI